MPFNERYLDVRFDYKPERPLYLVALRVYDPPERRTITYRSSYAGCRSWVPLEPEDEQRIEGSSPAMPDQAWGRLLERVNAAMDAG
jgi:hypothetical protein